MNYLEVEFVLSPLLPAREVLVAELAERGFDSFVDTDSGLKAYIAEPAFDQNLLSDLTISTIEGLQMSYSVVQIEDQNWNAEWEKNFQPILVDERCLVRAPFHHGLPSYPLEIIIEPKMSFGTGHHATTHLVISEMMKMDFTGKKVLDMGCGTGILAILAQMLGAEHTDAIDIDTWSYENTLENMERNQIQQITAILGGAEVIPASASYDVILANINRNILVRDMPLYNRSLARLGYILFSGFYTHDSSEIDQHATALGWKLVRQQHRDEWCAMVYQKV